jgi:microcystin-dependent protein
MADNFVGEIRMVGCNFEIDGWAFCNGALMSITENEALFNLIGTTYGGDGLTTFALPDLRGRIPVHQGNGFVMGATGGVDSVTLTLAQIPQHNHALGAQSTAGSSPSPAGNFWAESALEQFSTAAPTGQMGPLLGDTGGDQSHSNTRPYQVVNFLISLFGVYPSQ